GGRRAGAGAGLGRPRTVTLPGPRPAPPAWPPGSFSAVRSDRAGPPPFHLAGRGTPAAVLAGRAAAARPGLGGARRRPVRRSTGPGARIPAALLRLQRHEPVAHVAHGADQGLVLRPALGPQPPHAGADG